MQKAHNKAYLLWINEGTNHANVEYSITPPSHKFEVEHLDQSFSFLISSNSEVSKVKFVIEDNGLSTNTPTIKAWKKLSKIPKNVYYYKYKRNFPHHGTGNWILF